MDRPAHVRSGESAGGPDPDLGADRLERGKSHLRAGRDRRRHSGHAPDTARRTADRLDRRAQPSAREAGHVLGIRGQRAGVCRRARSGPPQRPHHVSRDRSRSALLRQGGRTARRQRASDDPRAGDGDGAARRSVVRLPAADLRAQHPRLRVPRPPRHAVRAALCRRPRGRQHPAAEARRHAARRQPRLLWDRATSQRSVVRWRRRARDRTAADVATDHRPQSRLAVHPVPEGDGAVSAALRRLRSRSDDE